MKVSVCMATYNGEKYIDDQLQSILQQINKQDEVIISDDGSTDNTINIIKRIDDKRIKLIFNKGKRGYTPNFENALKQSTGDIIFLSDQDDIWLSGKYNTVIENLKTFDLVVTNSKVTDEFLNVTNSSFFSIYNSGPGILKNITCSTYYGCCMAFNRKVLNFAMPFPEYKDSGIDLWIGIVGEIVGKVKFIDEPYLLWRRSDNTVTKLGSILSRSDRPFHLKIYKRLMAFYNIFKLSVKYRLLKN